MKRIPAIVAGVAVAARKHQRRAQGEARIQQHQGLIQGLPAGAFQSRSALANADDERRNETDHARLPSVTRPAEREPGDRDRSRGGETIPAVRPSVAPLTGGTRASASHVSRRLAGLSRAIRCASSLANSLESCMQRMHHPAIEYRVEMSAVERPTIEPQLDAFPETDLRFACQSGASSPSNGGVHLVIVVKHGGCAQELHRANRGVSQDVGHGQPPPSESDLHEHDAHLCQRGIGERCLGVGAGPAEIVP